MLIARLPKTKKANRSDKNSDEIKNEKPNVYQFATNS